MIAKLIAHAETRARPPRAARRGLRRRRGLAGEDQRRLPGPAASSEPDFVAGEVDTGFIDARLDALTAKPAPDALPAAEAASALAAPEDGAPWTRRRAGRLPPRRAAPRRRWCRRTTATFEARVDPGLAPAWAVARRPGGAVRGRRGLRVLAGRARPAATPSRAATARSAAPMPGRIVAGPGRGRRHGRQGPAAGDAGSHEDGARAGRAVRRRRWPRCCCAVGDQVTEGALLVRLEAAGESDDAAPDQALRRRGDAGRPRRLAGEPQGGRPSRRSSTPARRPSARREIVGRRLALLGVQGRDPDPPERARHRDGGRGARSAAARSCSTRR